MDIIFYLVYVLAGTYGMARWWAARSLKQLQVTRRFTDHIFTGESSTVEISIANRSLLPAPWVRYDESSPPELDGQWPADARARAWAQGEGRPALRSRRTASEGCIRSDRGA